MSGRVFEISPFASLDEEFRLHYGPNQSETLEPCREIMDPSIKVGLVDNNRINPKRLLLVNKDRNPIVVYRPRSGMIEKVEYPGKSAFLEFGQYSADRTLVQSIVSSILSVDTDRRDHLHCSYVGDIKNADWHTFWAPLQDFGKALHVRLVADRTIRHHEDPNMEDVEKLAAVFSREC
jgi:hypothetical protein